MWEVTFSNYSKRSLEILTHVDTYVRLASSLPMARRLENDCPISREHHTILGLESNGARQHRAFNVTADRH